MEPCRNQLPINFILHSTELHKNFCGFPGYKPIPLGWFKICVLFYDGNIQRLTESGFMGKPGMEKNVIPYTTAASEFHIGSSIRYKNALYGNYFLNCYMVKRILISFNVFLSIYSLIQTSQIILYSPLY